MDQFNLGTTTIRFKFMPTPSAKLHIGHAWLVFVMHTLVKAIRQQGRIAELVLVLDEINMTADGSFDDKITKQHGKQIVQDMEALEMAPDRVIYNGDLLFVEQAYDMTLRGIALDTYEQGCVRPEIYFLNNALLDNLMGVTHIVRGEDRREFNELYEECYKKLNCPTPLLDYIPLVLNANGVKIFASESYWVSSVLKKTTPDELLCSLVTQCIQQLSDNGQSLEPVHNREAAEKLLLGDDWRAILDGESSAKHRFYSRFSAQPRVDI